MTINNKDNFADAEVFVEHESHPPPLVPVEPTVVAPVFTTAVAEPVFDSETKDKNLSNQGASVGPKSNHAEVVEIPQSQDSDMASHNVQHKRNVVTGIISGVVIGAILLGPVGAIAGGFIGSSIINRREKRWCRRHGFHRHEFGCRRT